MRGRDAVMGNTRRIELLKGSHFSKKKSMMISIKRDDLNRRVNNEIT
jgi:hypothetical protein